MTGSGGQWQEEAQAGGVDLSRSAVSRAVLASTLQQPYVLYPALAGVLGFAAVAAFGPDLMFLVPAIVGTVIGSGGWAIDYFLRRNQHAGRYLQGVREALSGRRNQAIRDLREELGELGYADGLSQLGRLQERYQAFEELLGKKLSPTELTYARYLGMAEQVFLAGLDNLQRIAHTLAGVETIDVAYVQRRIGDLEQLGTPSETRRGELVALQDRLVLRRQQLDKVDRWQAQNEQAMTRIDETMAAIAAMTTVQGHAGTDLETAMKELHLLAGRAADYSIK
jgi:hypothetical protein